MLPEKIILFHNKSVYGKIMAFVNEFESSHTKRNYLDDISQFFQLMKGKSLEELTVDDLTYEKDDVRRYRETLIGNYKGASINRKLTTIRSLFSDLKGDFEFINPAVFEVKRVSEDDMNKIGTLTWDEVAEMIRRVEEYDNGLEKSIFIELGARTSIRISALLSLRWDKIKPMEDFYTITVLDKGDKWDTKPIPADLYERMLPLKTDSEQVFTLSKRTMQRAVESLIEEMGFESERNISFHSIKKMGVEYVLERTGDIFAAAEQANHSNIQTTYKHYLEMNKRKAIPNMAGLKMGKKLDDTILREMSKDDLLSLIDKAGEAIKARLIQEALKCVK